MPTEADTCRTLITPKLQAAGWEQDPHSIAEQRWFTDGRIVVHGSRAIRRKGKRADFILRYARDFPIAVVEAKCESEPAATGMQQAKDYAQILGLKFAYATNGLEIIEFDFITGMERTIPSFPTPAELWSRLRAAEKLTDEIAAQRLLTPANLTTGKEPRYYQQIAINRAVQSVLQGRRRVLLTMATGTGKTVVAFQICWKLWTSKWNRKNEPQRKPRILYLADRNFLVDDPKDKIFAPFGDARHKIEGGAVTHGRELYFATYQSIAKDERRPGLYKEFAPDFFDLVIVDECHRGSAKENSNWREILEYFAPAYQLGMTATPLRNDNRDTYLYFGNPIYTYSLKQGIDDGFLAPYRVHRIVTQWDAAGWRPSIADLDRYGRAIPDEQYETADFERLVALRARTQAIAKHLTDFLKKTDRFAKTIVFCVDQEHASEMRAALNNLNADLVRQYPDYVCRVTADEGDIGRGHMQRFQDVETRTPVILTTSQLLTTGLDAPTCRNVVLVRLVNSMVEFKQIIGRGTRVRDDYGKLWFNILDYTGTATRNFADPAFDGDPTFATQEEIDEYGKVTSTKIETPEEPESVEPAEGRLADAPLSSSIEERAGVRSRKYYFDNGQVEIVAELVHELDSDGRQLRVVRLTDYTAEKVRNLCASPDELRARWADAAQRADILQQLAERGIDFPQVAAQAGQPDADPFDLLCHLAFNAPVFTRRSLEAAASRVFQLLRPRGPRHPERPAGKIRQRRRTPIHAARRAESPTHFTTRQRERNHRQIRRRRPTPQRRQPTPIAAICGLTCKQTMPVFISYSHKDGEFVNRLAANLVRNKANVWLDEWEVAAGESLVENIQSAIQGASALVAVFSKASVASVWCKREVTAAIQKELEERRVVVIPALLEDCEVPLFLRDKKYADFRTDFDIGLRSILVGIAKVTNPSLGRIEEDEYHTDWSIDWGYFNDLFFLEFTLLQHSMKWPYTVLSTIHILCSSEATARYKPYEEAGLCEYGRLVIAESIIAALDGQEFHVLLEDSHKKRKEIEIRDPNISVGYAVTLESRRLGQDTGRDILMHGADELRKIRRMAAQVLKPLSDADKQRLQDIVRRNMARNAHCGRKQ